MQIGDLLFDAGTTITPTVDAVLASVNARVGHGVAPGSRRGAVDG